MPKSDVSYVLSQNYYCQHLWEEEYLLEKNNFYIIVEMDLLKNNCTIIFFLLLIQIK